jgi:hypothetical protein
MTVNPILCIFLRSIELFQVSDRNLLHVPKQVMIIKLQPYLLKPTLMPTVGPSFEQVHSKSQEDHKELLHVIA